MQSRQIHLVRRPVGVPKLTDFAVVECELPDLRVGDVEVQSMLLTVDPYMRPLLDKDQPLGEPMHGAGIGRVVRSRDPRHQEGTLVRHFAGMRDLFVSNGKALRILRRDAGLPVSVYLHALGATGLTAFGGLLEVGKLGYGEQVFISAAGGAVGSVAAQIAKINGCYVVGSTGSDEKAAWLRHEAGLDVAINYKDQSLSQALIAATPKGIDVYFENVGGAHFNAALERMNMYGRIPLCGTISTYNGGGESIGTLSNMIYRRIRMQGFTVTDFAHLKGAFLEKMTDWLKGGQVKYQETMIKGFHRVPEALIGLFSGANTGKMLVKVAD